MKTFRVTFIINGKYPTTRTVNISTNDKANAELLIHQQFGSFTIKKIETKIGMIPMQVPSDKITITECEEIVNKVS